MTTAASLQSQNFSEYPPQARQIASRSLETLRPLPILFVATLLREISRYDWLFPPERTVVADQLDLLKQKSLDSLAEAARQFDQIRLTAELERVDWAVSPDRFSEALTAYLWSSHQMDAFRTIAASYTAKLDGLRKNTPVQDARVCIVLLGKGAASEGLLMFEKLRSKGTLFENVSTADAFEAATEILRTRAQQSPGSYRHWWIDGGDMAAVPNCVTLSYGALSPLRKQILAIMESARTSGSDGPEGLRSTLHDLGRRRDGGSKGSSDPVLGRFTLELFSDGSGTQIYSTTFVQWAAREVLRRAHPSTMILRYAPRQSERPMNELISGNDQPSTVDLHGSLVDADMGTYYTWLNLRRLPSAQQDTLIACHEGGRQAIAISSSMAASAVSIQPCDLKQILKWTA